jgi:peptidyl-prolyl cis-trans isomerase C
MNPGSMRLLHIIHSILDKKLLKAVAVLFLITTVGCQVASAHTPGSPTGSPSQVNTSSVAPSVQATPVTPTVPPEPLAARVNGEGILLSDFQAELKRYQSASSGQSTPTPPATDSQAVLDDMIGQVLLAQAAVKAGHTITDAQVEERISQLTSQMGGPTALSDWASANGYTDASLRRMLRTAMLAAWQRDLIVTGVPQTADEVHARQILVREQKTADALLEKLKAGQKFATLAQQYDPLTGGDLGWFPKGYLTQPAVEQAAFQIQPGQYSEAIQTPLGFHIIQVIERDSQHTLAPDARRFLQEQALTQWIEDQRKQSQIEITVPTS